jgi:hypothetical protein
LHLDRGVDARQRRAEIQTHLNDARSLADAGERDAALEKVNAALALDDGNVAAQTLREEISSSAAPVRLKTEPAREERRIRPNPDAIREHEVRPLVSAEGLAQFEQRARQRRIERRLAAARAGIDGRRFIEARAALAEVRELDAARPELAALTLDLEAAERPRAMRATPGPLAAAAATFAGIILSASLIGNTGLLQSYPMTDIAALAPGTETASLSAVLDPGMPMATIGDQRLALQVAPLVDEPRVRNVAEIALDRPVAEFVEAPPAFVAVASAPATALVPLTAAAAPPTSLAPAAAIVPAAALVSTPAPAPLAAADIETDEAGRVRAVLQRYQTAYDRLDARLAQAVWPGVNQVALARAFDGLESQTLTFKDCDVRLLGSTASARCTGSTRYVPKVGSRAPRVEPLVWNFTLRRDTSDWQIETARADR